ncbi:hypothetical protein P4O66_006845 [Electrophorus voltai]|uniref:TLC domain-containing protein n=1 Tax=Electrophorus voltai TaxID=2609070 RepID=A0AAD8ZFN5_9TELE|nr:hypothetical protein P4O66_006845 [Electrophorus voltai]
MIETISEWFWWDRLWLPFNLTWTDLEDKDGRVYGKVSDLYITLPYSMGFLIIRYIFERFVATPLAAFLGLREKTKQNVEYNAILEHYYASRSKTPGKVDITGLSKKCGWSSRHMERWFRRRRNQERPGVLKKFREASWRFVFYVGAFIGGIVALYDVSISPLPLKPWFYNLREVWTAYPKQSILESQYWYYILEMSFYWSLLLSITFDVKRKDFKEQIIHHLATLTLLAFSWCANYIRVGTLVMLVHDSSDVFLESAKVLNYAKWEKTCNSLFALFAVVFMVTRLIIFPFWIIHCTWVYPPDHYPVFFGYYFFNAMLGILLMLHIFWAYLIVSMLKKLLFGSVSSDWICHKLPSKSLS